MSEGPLHATYRSQIDAANRAASFSADLSPDRCRANLEQIRQSRPHSGPGLRHFQCEHLQKQYGGTSPIRKIHPPWTPLGP